MASKKPTPVKMEPEILVEFHDGSPMPFGMHKGKRLIDVPSPYLLWLFNTGTSNVALRKYLVENIEAIQKEVEKIPHRPSQR